MGGFNTSVAMPSNAALEIRPPQSQSPLEIAAGFQEQRLRQQQIQGAQMENQQRQMDLQDQQVARQAYMDSGGDMNKFQQLLMQRGASPKLVTQMQQQMLTTRKTLAETDKVKLENDAARHDQARGELSAFEALPAVQKEARYQPLLNSMHQRGLMNDQEYSDFTQQHPTYPGSDDMKFAINHFATGAQLAKEAIEQQNAQSNATSAAARQTGAATGQTKETREAEQQQFQNAVSALGANPPQNPKEYEQRVGQLPPAVATRILNAVPPGQYDPAKSLQTLRQLGMTPEQQTQAVRAAADAEERARHNKVEEDQGAGRLSVERQNAARMQKQFDATYGSLLGPNGEQLTPEAQKAMAEQDPAAKAIANYQLAPPTAGRTGPGAGLLRKVMAINPNYNAQNWQTQAAMMKGFTSGSQSKEISGINTAMGHVGVLNDAIDALKNNDLQVLNRIANFAQVQTGGDAVTTFKAIVHKVAPEINRAYVGGVGSQGEILAQESDFDPKMGPQQLKSNAAITAKLLRSKVGSLENQWKQTMGSDFAGRFITPEAKATLDKLAPEGGGTATVLPKGGGKPADEGVIRQFLDASGGDKDKARKALTDSGWIIPAGKK